MRLQSISRFCIPALLLFSLFSCNKKDEFITENITDYNLLTPGKYITYRLDSLVFTNFGRTIETHRYQVKEQVDKAITDNLGRPSFRVFRYLSDSLGTTPWKPIGAYYITPLSDQVEVVEDNLRIIKMHMPMKDGFSWKGNKYLASEPYDPLYAFSNDNFMQDWDFYYDGESSAFSYRGKNYTNVFTVEEAKEAFNVPITTPTSFALKSRSFSKYSKNIGLVYSELELWDYQPNTSGSGGPFYTGFGIRKWMIDHN